MTFTRGHPNVDKGLMNYSLEYPHFRNSIGLIEAPLGDTLEAFVAWQEPILRKWRGTLMREPVAVDRLDDALRLLLPLEAPSSKSLFVGCPGGWTMLFSNGLFGADAGQIRVLAEKIRTRTIRAVAVPDLRGKQYGAVIWEVNDRHGKRTRVVFAANDGGRWEFFASGEPLEFENVEAYTARRIKDRFTGEMLEYYLSQMNLFPFSDDWITAPVEAGLVERLRRDRRGSYTGQSRVN